MGRAARVEALGREAAQTRAGLHPRPGVDARRVPVGSDGMGEYFTKMAAEITAAHTKAARTGGRSPFTLARDAAESNLEEDVLLLWEYQRASHGRRQLEWSPGRLDLRTLAGGPRPDRRRVRCRGDRRAGPDRAVRGHLVGAHARCGRYGAARRRRHRRHHCGDGVARPPRLVWSVPTPAPLRARTCELSPQTLSEARAGPRSTARYLTSCVVVVYSAH